MGNVASNKKVEDKKIMNIVYKRVKTAHLKMKEMDRKRAGI